MRSLRLDRVSGQVIGSALAIVLLGSQLVLNAQGGKQDPPVKDTVPEVIQPSAILTFDHYKLTIVDSPGKQPLVLTVKDGEHFAVKVIETDNRLFNYTITADTAAQPQATTTTVDSGSATTDSLTGPHSSAIVPMIHSSHFVRYRFQISLKTTTPNGIPEAKPKGAETGGAVGGQEGPTVKEPPFALYATSFDVWVKTKQDFQVSFNGGVAFSNLRDHKYFIKTAPPTSPTAVAVKTVEEDTSAQDQFRPDVVIFANVRNPGRLYGVGMSFGFGIGDSSNPRYFVGPSWIFGKNFILNAGWTGGKVAVLPTGQAISQPPVNGDNTLNQLGSRFQNGFYAGIGFVFDAKQQTDFLGPLAAGQSSQDSSKPQDKAAPALPAAADLSKYIGSYATESGADKVEVTFAGGKLTTTFNGTGKTGAFQLTPVDKSPDNFTVDGEKGATVQFVLSSGKYTALQYHGADGKAPISYNKK